MNQSGQIATRVGTFRIGDIVLVALGSDIDDATVMEMENSLTEEISRKNTTGVIIDTSQLDIVDTFTGRMLGALTKMSRILDARTIVVGMRPAVAITLVELGMPLVDLETALNVDRGMEKLRYSGPGGGFG
tara:strand:- start:391 stop:783 length:393 start_codon:yes stop_codon:yes gene_type:complete